ncbi:MAG: galactose-1-phosphate uridylyltransferase [Planctomycetota bacterium]|nr:galactose-1-phosphate uridylyltransferase [Planctomycetota bacterium]
MPELRRDPISGRWVIVAPDRARRPLPGSGTAPSRENCPFCAGHESETPDEILALRPPGGGGPNTPGWQVRVVPNRFPALSASGPDKRQNVGVYRTRGGVGVHEVIIESPDHHVSLTQLTPEAVEQVLSVFRERLESHRRRTDLHYALLFKNVGLEAGASIEHTHSQIMGTRILPGVIGEEWKLARREWRARRRCLLCEMIRLDASDGRRMVVATDSFVAICPFASRFPLEVWIVPTSHESDFDAMSENQIDSLAPVLRDVLGRVERVMGRPSYNLVLHTAPFRRRGDDSFHWHIEVMPRLGQAAGFEWGSGLFVNPLTPEDAAARLRDGDAQDTGAV